MTKYMHIDTDGTYYHIYYSIGKRNELTHYGRYKSLESVQEKVTAMQKSWEGATGGDTQITFDLRGDNQ